LQGPHHYNNNIVQQKLLRNEKGEA
jgi:hypothetical protein